MFKSEPFRAQHGLENMVCNGGHGIYYDGELRENSPLDYDAAIKVYDEAVQLGYGVLVALDDSEKVYTRDFRFYDQSLGMIITTFACLTKSSLA